MAGDVSFDVVSEFDSLARRVKPRTRRTRAQSSDSCVSVSRPAEEIQGNADAVGET